MTYEHILSETDGRVGIIRLNRPEKLNAWTDTMNRELQDQVGRWNDDDGIGAFVVTGEGRAFCGGADMDGFGTRLDHTPTRAEQTKFSSPLTHLLRQGKPSVFAIHGYAVGVGLTMALPGDVRIAATDALMSIRFIRVGLVPELGSTRLLAQIVGLGHATDMSLTGRMVNAEEALRMGLVTAVVEPDQLFDTAMEKARQLAENPTPAVMLVKELLADNPVEGDLDVVMEREQVRDRLARTWPEHAEAVRAFAEKRKPNFFE